MNLARALFVVAAIFGAAIATAQDKPADNMDILKEKLRADKKLVVAENMGLSESEAAAFWPVYGAYQKELEGVNQRIRKLIESYAADYRSNTLTDEKATQLIKELLAVEQAEVDLKKSYVPKLSAVLPAKKVARYLQIENKIRTVGKYELAAGVPLVE